MSKSINTFSLLDVVNEGVPLLDGITVMFGPREELGRFFLAADYIARQVGVHLRLHDNLASLAAANEQLQTSWGPLVPILDPAESQLTPDTSFWISAHNSTNELVGTIAGRRLTIGSAGLTDELRSLRLFYSSPGPHLEKGTQCLVGGEAKVAGDLIAGQVTYSGGNWVRPDFRHKGLPYLFARVVRHLAMTRWDSSYTVSAVRVNLAAIGVLEGYGYRNISPGISMRNSYRGDFDLSLVWMDRKWMETELIDYLEAFDQKMILGAAVDEMDNSVPRRHGSNSLS